MTTIIKVKYASLSDEDSQAATQPGQGTATQPGQETATQPGQGTATQPCQRTDTQLHEPLAVTPDKTEKPITRRGWFNVDLTVSLKSDNDPTTYYIAEKCMGYSNDKDFSHERIDKLPEDSKGEIRLNQQHQQQNITLKVTHKSESRIEEPYQLFWTISYR